MQALHSVRSSLSNNICIPREVDHKSNPADIDSILLLCLLCIGIEKHLENKAHKDTEIKKVGNLQKYMYIINFDASHL